MAASHTRPSYENVQKQDKTQKPKQPVQNKPKQEKTASADLPKEPAVMGIDECENYDAPKPKKKKPHRRRKKKPNNNTNQESAQ